MAVTETFVPIGPSYKAMDGHDGLTELVEAHRSRIYTYSCYFLGHTQDAEDVTQEVLVRLWKHRHTVGNGRLNAWLTRVTRNACIDTLRKRGSYRAVVAEGDYNDTVGHAPDHGARRPDKITAWHDFRDHVRQAIRALPEPYRSVVILRELQDMAYNDISTALDMPLNTVKCYLHRGRRMLRGKLRENGRHDDV